MLETSQEEETLVDPQDNVDYETQDQTSGEQNKEQEGQYDSDADTVDPREEDEPSKKMKKKLQQ